MCYTINEFTINEFIVLEVMGKMSGDKYPEDKRLVFDMITEQFDEWRGRYSEELFEYIRTTCELKTGKNVWRSDREPDRHRILRFSPAVIIRQLNLEKILPKQCKRSMEVIRILK